VDPRPAMSCSFDLAHYRELIEAAKTGGYRFAFFDETPRAGDLLLRHDIDLSLDAALAMAELEAELEAPATYLLMSASEFYNLAAPSGEAAIVRLRRLGHRVGFHALYPRARPDPRLDPVLAWHNPDPEYMTAPVNGFTNAMQSGFFDPACYRSDSNQHWRHGCPHQVLARGEFEWLQLLVHPAIWVYPGETMRETMLAMLDAERELRTERLAADRIDIS
jgi:hypothetical protein